MSREARAEMLAQKVGVTDLATLRRQYGDESTPCPAVFKKKMEFERAFVKAGGLLRAGADPTAGGVLPGYGDQREVELLVEAGFSPVEAIHIATANGAESLERARQTKKTNGEKKIYTLEEMENIISALVDHVEGQLVMAITFYPKVHYWDSYRSKRLLG